MNSESKIKNKKLLNCFIVILFLGFFVLFLNAVCAQGIVPAPSGGGEGDYTLNDFVKIAINIAAWILSITGSLALLFFIYGGFMFLISAGSSERVTKAKQIIVGAVVGVVIVLTSFLIINTVLTSLGYKSPCGNEWYKLIDKC